MLCAHLALLPLSDTSVEGWDEVSDPSGTFSSAAARNRWEEQVLVSGRLRETTDSARLGPTIDRALQTLTLGRERGEDGAGVFVSELLEMFELNTMAADRRRRLQPALWTYRTLLSKPQLVTLFWQHGSCEADHPVLSIVFKSERQLQALRFIPSVVRWQTLLFRRYNHRLSRQAARHLTVRDAIESLAEHERQEWRAVFEDVKSAWRLAWAAVTRFDCLEIPASFRSFVMDYETPLSFSLASDSDEGICPLALLQHLITLQNTIIDKLPQAAEEAGEAEISSRLVSAQHVIDFDFDGGIMPYVEERCVCYTERGGLTIDFRLVEAFVVANHLSGRCRVEMEVRKFDYLHEVRSRCVLRKAG